MLHIAIFKAVSQNFMESREISLKQASIVRLGIIATMSACKAPFAYRAIGSIQVLLAIWLALWHPRKMSTSGTLPTNSKETEDYWLSFFYDNQDALLSKKK